MSATKSEERRAHNLLKEESLTVLGHKGAINTPRSKGTASPSEQLRSLRDKDSTVPASPSEQLRSVPPQGLKYMSYNFGV